MNLGYQSALNLWGGGFDFVVLLNPDVISAGPTVCELVNRAAGHPSEVGVWGAVLTDPAGKLDRGCARRVWNLRRLFSHLVGYDNLVKVLRTAPRNLSEYEIQGNQSELAMVSGALMCIDSGLFGAGLNTLLPMYLEDQEICMRSLAEGHLIMLYPPDLVAVHAGGVSRKSLTDHDRALRIMELVEAPPVQCMARLQGYSALSLRLTVFLGGISRIVAAFFLAASFKVFLLRRGGSNQVAWMLEQQRLGGLWFALWAIKGAIHDEEVSLSDYFFWSTRRGAEFRVAARDADVCCTSTGPPRRAEASNRGLEAPRGNSGRVV